LYFVPALQFGCLTSDHTAYSDLKLSVSLLRFFVKLIHKINEIKPFIKKNIFWVFVVIGFLASILLFLFWLLMLICHTSRCYDFICLFSSVFAAYFSILDFAVKGCCLFLRDFRRQQNGL
jgi:hypothetical protein